MEIVNNNDNETYLVLIVGTNGMGKTTLIIESIKSYLKNTDNDFNVIIIDPQKTFPRIKNKRVFYPTLNKVKVGRHYELKIGNVRFEDYLDKITNSLVIIDDTRILFADWQGRDLMDLAINRRHRSNDLIFVYHSLGDIQKSLYATTTEMYLFKINENWNRVKNTVPMQLTESMFNKAIELKKHQYIKISLVPDNDFEND